MAERLFVHGPSAEREVLREFPSAAGRTTKIDLGNWIDYYPCSVTRSAARAALGLSDDDYVFLFLGLCKPYKNVEGLIAAFRRLQGSPRLIISGKIPDAAYEAAIRSAIASEGDRITLHAGFVPDEKIQIYMRACDMVTAPYLDTLTSGTAMLAISFGRPVVAPDRGFLKDLVSEECGILYEPSYEDGLELAMSRAMTASFEESRIMARARAYDWKNAAATVLESLSGTVVK